MPSARRNETQSGSARPATTSKVACSRMAPALSDVAAVSTPYVPVVDMNMPVWLTASRDTEPSGSWPAGVVGGGAAGGLAADVLLGEGRAVGRVARVCTGGGA